MRRIVLATTALVAALAVWAGAAAKVGSKAPDFTLQDQNGKTVHLADYAGKIVVLEWVNPSCPFVKRHYSAKTMVNLESKYKDKGVVWLSINSTAADSKADDQKWADSNSLDYPVLDDSSSEVAKLYGAKTTPHMFVIDKDGAIVYNGAIDNDREGAKSSDKVNYVEKALDEVLAGRPVTTPETQPYGCTVHYK